MLITNANLITLEQDNRILLDHAVYINGDLIADVGPQRELTQRYPDAERLDIEGQYLMPGNICAHTHFYGAFARGMGIPGAEPKDFPEILEKLWWPLDLALDDEAVHYSALVMLVDAIKHGTTTLFDHHASPNAIEGSLDLIADAVDISGLRAVLCYEVTDRNGYDGVIKGIDENIRFYERTKNEKVAFGRVAATFGLHASLTLSEEALNQCVKSAPDNIGFHLHVAEHEVDEYDSLSKTGTRIVDRLHSHGVLGPRSIAAHAVHIDARETALLSETGTWVTHQPRSNMNNGVGVPDIDSFLRMGIPVCIGTDGFQHAMWDEWKTTYLLHKVWHRDPRRMSGIKIFEMGVYNNAKLASTFFKDAPIGKIIPGAFADFIVVDYHPPTPINTGNLPWHILFGFNESMVTTSIVAGKILMRNRQLLTINEKEVFQKARELVPDVWKRYDNQFS